MRLQRLELMRYGHFTDKSVDLPKRKSDFHIVFGPNEAGKSTALTAIEDLLFGIPGQSPYNFLYNYTEMRVGAVIENGSLSLPVIRRKGNKDTLLGADGLPISGGDGALAPFLKGADRGFFERMFSLDHKRLEQGGQDILQAKDDVGQMLFAAGAGIAGLRDQLKALLDEADALWSRTRAQRRQYYQALDRLKEAEAGLRNQSLSAAKWRGLKKDLEKAEEACRKADEVFKDTSAERNRLNRIRRVYHDVRRKQELDAAIAALGEVVSLPEDALAVFGTAERETSAATALIETLEGQLKQAQAALEELAYDETLILRADDVAQLHKQRIEVEGERADLPNRQADLEREENELRELASELGWETEDATLLLARIPGRAKVSVVRTLLNQRGELVSEVSNKTEALQEAKDDLSDMETAFGTLGETADASKLAAVIRAIREKGDIAGWVRDAEKELTAALRRIDRLFGSLKPEVTKVEDVAKMDVPAAASVQGHASRVQAWESSTEENRRQIKAVERELAKSIKARELAVSKEEAVAPEALEEVRERRNALWRLVKLKHIEKKSIPAKESAAFADDLDDLASAFEPTMEKADTLADRRFDNAEATARVAEISRTIDRQQEELAQLNEDGASLAAEGDQLKSDWTAMWAKAPFEPLEPNAMLTWLQTRHNLLEAIEERETALGERDTKRAQEAEAKARLVNELATLEVDTSALENKALSECLQLAADEQRKLEAQAQNKARLAEDIVEGKKDVARRQQQLTKAETALADWQAKWSGAVGEIGLAADLLPEAVSAQIDVIDLMREKEDRIIDLRHNRIDKIRRDITDFERIVRSFVEQVAKNLKGKPAEEAVLDIEKRLAEAQRLCGLYESKSKDIDDLDKKIATAKEERRQAAVSVAHLKEAASVESDDALTEAIAKSDQLRARQADLAATVEKLEKEGDGLSVEDLEKECAGVDIDQIAAQAASIDTELADLQQRLTDAIEERSTARQAFEAIGGDDAAARAASARQDALSEIRAISERYVRVRTSALMLQWAIDRYRREKQAPLLKRAGELFTTITGGSFKEFRVVYDEHDQPKLTGVRSNGSLVPVVGMSTGTEDQLYMALRVASIEDYSIRADVLPFVADDLFINFDNDRAAAGFRVLAQLAEKTQVLFFTHHQHLVDIAKATLGASVSVISLNEEPLVATA